MNVTVHLLPTRKETRKLDLEEGSTAEQAIRALGLLPDQWVPIRGDSAIPIDDVLVDGDELKLMSVVSGG